VLSDEAEALDIKCWVLAPTKMEKSVEQALVNKVVLESRFILNPQSGLETSR
jgi:hypothetical protein